jgi:pSer/pThr/pTyr-binding forkhead associated (FHA) protein
VLKLLVKEGPAIGTVIEVERELEVGRAAEEAGQLAGDVEISRRHARVSRQEDGGYSIEDLGSTNGTLVNGTAITGLQPLAPGDTVELGATTLEVQSTGVPADEAPAPADVAAPVRIALEIEIHAEGGLATVRLDDSPDATVELEHRDGAWRLAGSG